MIDYKLVGQRHFELYGTRPRLFRAPGRVNLIGEHTDYNGGFVLPMAIGFETVVAASPRPDRKIRAYTNNYEQTAEVDLDKKELPLNGNWFKYVEGVARILVEKGYMIEGADLFIQSNVPVGSGLSSSAALEIAIGLALTEIYGISVDRRTLAKVGQQTEHDFLNANVGIMDQFVSANAIENHALLLDCRSLEFENVPLKTDEFVVVICDTNVKHEIANSAYNERREECETAVVLLKKFYPNVNDLRDVSSSELESVSDKLPDLIHRRARHIVSENERTIEAGEALRNRNIASFGSLMDLSHISMRDDFEISCRELDILVSIANKCDGVFGSRMTGGGFGGSTVSLVRRENLDQFRQVVDLNYQDMTNIKPTIFISDAGKGASEIALKDLA